MFQPPFFQGPVIVSCGEKTYPFFSEKKPPITEEDMEKLQTEQKLLDAELEVNLMGF